MGGGGEAEWLERGGGVWGHCEWLLGWMDGLSDGRTDGPGAECIRLRTRQLQDWLSAHLQAGPHVWIKLHRLHRFYYGSRKFPAGSAVVPLDILRFSLLSFSLCASLPEISGSQTATRDLQKLRSLSLSLNQIP